MAAHPDAEELIATSIESPEYTINQRIVLYDDRIAIPDYGICGRNSNGGAIAYYDRPLDQPGRLRRTLRL